MGYGAPEPAGVYVCVCVAGGLRHLNSHPHESDFFLKSDAITHSLHEDF